jgi:hypothetical protein
MTDTEIPPLERGVRFETPPASILEQATRLVNDAAQQLAPGERGGIALIATTAGWNAATVVKTGERSTITAWIGSTWGELIPEAGVVWSHRW